MKEYKTIPILKSMGGINEQTVRELENLSIDGWEIVHFFDMSVLLERKKVIKKIRSPKQKDAK